MGPFRFRGSIEPRPGIRASILEEGVVDGVATLRLYDPIDSWGGEWGVSAKEFAAVLSALPADTGTIRLHLNSPGGEVFEAVAILNMLREHRARVVAVVDGLAASAASFLAAGSDEVIMGRNTQLMIHDAWGLAIGDAAVMRDVADRLDRISENVASVYASRNAATAGVDWRAAMLAETWFSAEEAVAAGLADSIAGAQDSGAQNRFDLSSFRYAGRAQAPDPQIKPAAAAAAPAARPLVAERASRMRSREGALIR